MTGPVGAAVGATVGAAAGALAGRSMAKAAPMAEDAYWRDNYTGRHYVESGSSYDDYAPAYRYGVDAYSRYPGRQFDEFEPELSRDWDTNRGRSSLGWERAKHATRDAWQRLSAPCRATRTATAYRATGDSGPPRDRYPQSRPFTATAYTRSGLARLARPKAAGPLEDRRWKSASPAKIMIGQPDRLGPISLGPRLATEMKRHAAEQPLSSRVDEC